MLPSTAARARTSLPLLLTLLLACAGVLLVRSGPASAATTSGWASWTPITGKANDYATTMTLPAGGFPRATVATDSRANVALPSGASTFLGAGTPVGAKYGTSRNHAYVNLRPEADSPTTPSTTTYTFDRPTPAAGWTFVLGDIDADKVTVAAGDVDGTPVPAATIDGWYRSSFNYAGGTDTPVWDGATSTLTGNAAAADTDGAAAWFEPDVALTSLTFSFTARSGFPIYQTWFASTAHTISGQVADTTATGAPCPVDKSVLHLIGPDGSQLATTSPVGGAYSFGQYALQSGYRVTIEAPDGCALTGAAQRGVDTTAGDGTADFTVRTVVPQAVSGVVSTPAGDPVAGVAVTLTPPAPGVARTTTTDADGGYLFDDNAEQPGYQVAVTGTPDGFAVSGPATHTFDIVAAQAVPAQDFTVVEQASVQGTVTGGGDPLGGVGISLTPDGGGPAVTTATTGAGRYEFPHVPAGSYDISVTPPDGYRPVPARTDVVVGTADRTGLDFALSRPGAVAGVVTDDAGHAVADVPVQVTDGDGDRQTVATDTAGAYFLDGLDPDGYRLHVVVPTGYRADGPADRTVTITSAGEVRGGQDFVLTRVATAPPSTSATPGPTASSSPVGGSGPGGNGSGTLAATGTDTTPLLGAGLLAIAVGLLLVRVTRRRH